MNDGSGQRERVIGSCMMSVMMMSVMIMMMMMMSVMMMMTVIIALISWWCLYLTLTVATSINTSIISSIYYSHPPLPLPSLLLQIMVVFNIVSMSCFKLVSASSLSSSSSEHARRSVSRNREGGLAADLPGGGSIREVTRRRRRWRSKQYQVN